MHGENKYLSTDVLCAVNQVLHFYTNVYFFLSITSHRFYIIFLHFTTSFGT